ncbi:hypothetical protein HF521_005159 [Silurus meridionalis]|uniref:Uncharacterized protein n=1 Tax=Silurus meridionalis TaxID=175797 RepID=A0A8T0AVM7_SILME|nr:hypothetical protein HF521_005159 [Silurus meridionalis]
MLMAVKCALLNSVRPRAKDSSDADDTLLVNLRAQPSQGHIYSGDDYDNETGEKRELIGALGGTLECGCALVGGIGARVIGGGSTASSGVGGRATASSGLVGGATVIRE